MAPIFVPTPESPWPLPKLSLQIHDLDHPGVEVFLGAVRPVELLKLAVKASHQWLYAADKPPRKVDELLLVLRAMDGVAYATGCGTQQQIHLSLDYVQRISTERIKDELFGVLVHETVHCFQYNGNGSCPGGLIEGIADFVRLRAGYAPPHWKRRVIDTKWDAGYDTTAYFLDWIEDRHGAATVCELNHCMKDAKFHKRVFRKLTGQSVRKLWGMYSAEIQGIEFKDGEWEETDDEETEEREMIPQGPSRGSDQVLIKLPAPVVLLTKLVHDPSKPYHPIYITQFPQPLSAQFK